MFCMYISTDKKIQKIHFLEPCWESCMIRIPQNNSNLYSVERIIVLNYQKDRPTKTKVIARKPLCLQTNVKDYTDPHYNMTGKCLQSCDKYHSPFTSLLYSQQIRELMHHSYDIRNLM